MHQQNEEASVPLVSDAYDWETSYLCTTKLIHKAQSHK